jgi:predicted nucleotidyltransferase
LYLALNERAPRVSKLHPAVERVVLSGSCGLDGRPRPDSDVDLSMVVARDALPAGEPEREQLLRSVLEATLSTWAGLIEDGLHRG